jgi:hypothetical protein
MINQFAFIFYLSTIYIYIYLSIILIFGENFSKVNQKRFQNEPHILELLGKWWECFDRLKVDFIRLLWDKFVMWCDVM